MKNKNFTNSELQNHIKEMYMQAELDRINLHNKLGPHRQPKETVFQYRKRLQEVQTIKGYSNDDYIFV